METKISLINGLELFIKHTDRNIKLINSLVEQIKIQNDVQSEELIQAFADHIADSSYDIVDFFYDIVDFFDVNLDKINDLCNFNAKDDIISALSTVIENQDSTTVLLDKFLDAYYDSWEQVQKLNILETVPYAILHLEDSKTELRNLINKLK